MIQAIRRQQADRTIAEAQELILATQKTFSRSIKFRAPALFRKCTLPRETLKEALFLNFNLDYFSFNLDLTFC
jgi:hypothetical protein